MNIYDMVIAGTGPAGMTAAIYGARADLKVLLLDKLAPGGQIVNTNEIQNYTGMGFINGADLAIRMFEHTQRLEVEFDYGTVCRIEAEGAVKELHIEEDPTRIIKAKTVLLATGTRPNRLHVPNEDRFIGSGISFCAICDGAAYRGKEVVVIGGGNSAVEEGIYLSGIAKKVIIVTMFDLTADPISCDQLQAKPNVKIYTYRDILDFVEKNGRLAGVHFKSSVTGEEDTLCCDGVFEYIGLSPVTDFVKDLGVLNEFGYVVTDERMRTAIPGIYGAGDCILKQLRQVITACADGSIAALAAADYIKKHEEDWEL